MIESADLALAEEGLASADPDALKVTLFHLTGDSWLSDLPRGAEMSAGQREGLVDRARAWLANPSATKGLAEPPLPQLRSLMELALGRPMGDDEFEARRDVPCFRDYPFMVDWEGERPEIPPGFRVAIIGSGFAGVAAAVQLDRLGIDYVVLERRAEPGGVWSINHYPDVRVDTASITYEFPFERGHRWGEFFARGGDVQNYIDQVSRSRGIRARTRFEHDVQEAQFDEALGRWQLTVATPGGVAELEANVVVTAGGLFANPRIAAFAGQERFKGRIVHPSAWPDDLDLAGRHVATIGNGSTGVQMLGAIAREAAQVHVFQRTPQWIQPRANYGKPIGAGLAWLLDHLPGYANWWRFTTTSALFELHDLMTPDAAWQAAGGRVSRANDALRESLIAYIRAETGGRDDLVSRLIPEYAPMSRRPVIDNGWYRALTRDNVELVTDPITSLSPNAIRTADGRERPVDLIVAATGYDVARYLAPMRITGRGGADLHSQWEREGGPRAYLGMAVPNFPNFFMLYGPNSQPIAGEASMPAWFALWSSYVARAVIGVVRAGAHRIEVTRAAFERYNAELDAEARGLVQLSGEGGMAHNYFLDRETGRLQVSAPWRSIHYHRLCTRIDWDDFELA